MSTTLTPIEHKVNELLDRIRATHHLTSDEGLAHHLGVSLATIARLRNGQINKTARILVRIATEESANQPADITT